VQRGRSAGAAPTQGGRHAGYNRHVTRRLSWIVLLALGAALLVGAATFDHAAWPSLVGDESTYLMAAQSLAFDHDYLYTAADYHRFVALTGRQPDGVILQRSPRGLTFAKPLLYPLAIAPFVRLAPARGPAIANALFVVLAALAAARALERRLGPAAALWVAACLFASVAFAYVFWAHEDAFLLALTAAGLAAATAWRTEDGPPLRRTALAGPALGGVLLALVTLGRPVYAGLLLAGAAITARDGADGGRRLRAFAVAAVATLIVAGGAHRLASGVWNPYGGERQGFYSAIGFPEVNLQPGLWDKWIAEGGTGSWLDGFGLSWGLDGRLLGWNSLYFLAGRDLGLLPYFLPGLLAVFLFRPGGGRAPLLLAVALGVLLLFLLRPFNFFGGGGAIANRYFLPLYPALWFAVGRPLRARTAVLCGLLAAPFLWPLWSAPRAFPWRPDGTYRWVTPAAVRLLPFETTQSHLKPAGREDVVHHDLWVKFLDPSIAPTADNQELVLAAGATGTLLVGSAEPLRELELTLPGGGAPPRIGGARIEGPPDGAPAGTWLLGRLQPRAAHPMWWTQTPFHLYQLSFTSPGPALRFALRRAAR